MLFLCLLVSLRSFHLHFIPSILSTTPRFLTLFSQSYFCLIGPFNYIPLSKSLLNGTPQWGAADAEIKVPSGENTEKKRKRSPFKAWSRSEYSHTCYAYCQGFLSFLLISTLPVHSPAFFQNLSRFFPVLAVANTWFLCRPAE